MKYVVILLVVLAIGAGFFFVFNREAPEPEVVTEIEDLGPQRNVIGQSIEGRTIEAYTYGDGDTHLLFVGGIHGGYEWNSVVLAQTFMDHLGDNPDVIPEDVTVTVIPSLNPDGVYKIIGKEGRFTPADVPSDVSTVPGRFNANDVDLNRNFGCKWNPEGVWRGNAVGTGEEAFSEPEARALQDFVLENEPDAVVFWHSQASAVYASECEEGILPETLILMNTYARAAGYQAIETFDAYEVNGDAEGWLASLGIPTISVELSTHEVIEWEENLAGIEAMFSLYGK